MHHTIIALAAGLALSAAAHAQDVRQKVPQDPAQAAAPVPSAPYVSALAEYRSAQPARGTPDTNWAAANATVGKPGHAGHAMHATKAEKTDEAKKPQEHHHEH